MWFWWFMFVCDLLIPLVMVVAGWMMWKYCPKKINMIYGYRTKRSMINIDTWKFAHDYCGRLWFKMGVCMFVPSVLVHIPFYYSDEDVIGTIGAVLCVIQVVALIVAIFPTEKVLKNTFNDDGTRK